MKSPFLDYWSGRKERGEVLEKRQKLKLTAAQLSSLFGDSDVRAALQNSRVASLLPPVGTEVFRRFTPASLEQIKKCANANDKQDEEDYHLKPSPELESGKVLPFFYGAPPPELQNVPLEDPDPFYQSQKTFVVVTKGNELTRFNADSSCFHFSPFSLFRRAAIKILNFKLFTALLLVALLVNICIMFPYQAWEFLLEVVFLSLYFVEAMLKILSKGFCLGRFTYLRDSWNRLDVFIIITGVLFFSVPQMWFLKPLRCLKILGLFSGTRRHAKTFGRALNRLWDVFFLTLLVLTVFSILGLGLFSGSLRNKCVLSWNRGNSSILDQNATEEKFDYNVYINNRSNYYYQENNLHPQICGNASLSSECPSGFICIQTGITPDYGWTNFDTFPLAFLASFRLMTKDYWEALAGEVMQAEGSLAMVYFVVTLFLCSFSLTCFIIAAFIITFAGQTEEEVQEAKQDQRDHSKILAAFKDEVEDELPEKKDAEKRSCTSCLRLVCSWDCCGCWVRLKKGLQVLVLDPFFDLAIIILLILNVCFMSMEHFPLTPQFEETLSIAELVFTFIFVLEVVLKILALGPYDYFKVGWHIFDTVLVVLNFLDLSVAGDTRCVIVFRLFRLARWWPGFLKWIRLVWAGLCSLWMLALVLTVLFFTYFGNSWFGPYFKGNVCKISSDCQLPRWHMSSLHHSLMTVIRILGGEWIETMWDCMEVAGPFFCVVFYVTVLIVGNFLLFTLFLTLLMKWINNKLAPEDEERMKTLKQRVMDVLKVCGMNKGEAKKEKTGAAEESVALSCVTPQQTEENGTQSSTLPIGEAQNFQKMKETEDPQDVPDNCFCQKCYTCCPALDLDKSQGCGRVWSNLRQSTFNIIQHPYVNNFIFFVVLVSSVALVFEDKNLPMRPNIMVFLGYLDQVITYLFVLEILFKWIGLGFKRYFTDGWCWLDLLVTLACVLSVAAQTSGLGSALISLKALRPLRILTHLRGTRLSVGVLLRMLPSLLDSLLVLSAVWLFFSIVFVQMFAGKFYYCLNETSDSLFFPEEVFNKSECMVLIEMNETDVSWKKAYFTFDSVFEAQLSLFSLATFKGWIDIIYHASDVAMIESQPSFEHNSYFYYVFIPFFLFGGFFCCIYILKTLLDSYSSQTHKIGGSHLFLNETQQKKFDNMSFQSKRPLAPCPRPQGRLRARLFDLVSREAFEWVMQGFIFAGVLLMMLESHDMSAEQEIVLWWLQFVLILTFTVESFLKICAFRRSYFSDNLNTIDFVVIILSVFGLLLSDLMSMYFIHTHCFHLLRLGRISRIIHRLPGALRLRLLFSAWTKSLPALFNLTLILFVLIFTYTSFGTFHFASLTRPSHSHISDVLNFETFGSSLIYMITVTTWASWDGLLVPILYRPPDCEANDIPELEIQASCGNPSLGVAFILSFLCLSAYVILLMLLVLLVDMLNVFGAMSCDPLSALNLHGFFKTWKKFVPDSAHYIQRSQLPDLCANLKKPLRITKRSDLDLDLSPEDPVHCRDVLLALSVQALGDSADKEALRARINEKYHEFMPSNPSQESRENSCTLQMNQEEATPVTEEVEE